MRVLIVGCGSIGTRRARLLADMGHEIETIDPENPVHAAKLGRVTTLLEVCQRRVLPEAVFICTPAETHVPIALALLNAGAQAVFIEKPLAVDDHEMTVFLIAAAIGRTVMVACNMRWAYFGSRLALRGKLKSPVRFYSHKPLSKWRAGAETYRRHGIVLESAIHEIDLAVDWLGPITAMAAKVDEDHVLLTCSHSTGMLSEISVCWAEDGGEAREVRVHGQDVAYLPDTSDRMYVQEMEHFLHCARSGQRPCNTIEDAAHVLGWALEANKAVTVTR